jgi:hypothetical protein
MLFNKKNKDPRSEIRPRFQLISPYSIEEISNLILDAAKKDDTVFVRRIHDMFYFDIPQKDSHYWSPELRISMEENMAGEGTLIRAVVGPRHAVWLLFIFIYGFLGVISLFGGMFGLAQYNLGISSGWIWCFPITFLLLIGVYVTAKIGQGIGRNQMLHLISVLYHAIGEKQIERIH